MKDMISKTIKARRNRTIR